MGKKQPEWESLKEQLNLPPYINSNVKRNIDSCSIALPQGQGNGAKEERRKKTKGLFVGGYMQEVNSS